MKETLKLEPQQVIEFINYVKRLTLDELTDLTSELTCIEYELLEETTTKIIQANSITRIDLLKKALNEVVDLQQRINIIKVKLIITDGETKSRYRK